MKDLLITLEELMELAYYSAEEEARIEEINDACYQEYEWIMEGGR